MSKNIKYPFSVSAVLFLAYFATEFCYSSFISGMNNTFFEYLSLLQAHSINLGHLICLALGVYLLFKRPNIFIGIFIVLYILFAKSPELSYIMDFFKNGFISSGLGYLLLYAGILGVGVFAFMFALDKKGKPERYKLWYIPTAMLAASLFMSIIQFDFTYSEILLTISDALLIAAFAFLPPWLYRCSYIKKDVLLQRRSQDIDALADAIIEENFEMFSELAK